MHVVTLCTGNAARSVIAGAVLARAAPSVRVSTRGTHVIDGLPMSWRTRDAIEAIGCRADGHRSRQLDAADLADADAVIDRMAELRHQIADIRDMFVNDLRFVEQF